MKLILFLASLALLSGCAARHMQRPTVTEDRLTSAMADLALKRTARDKADSDFALAIEEARAACQQVASEITALANGSETPAGS